MKASLTAVIDNLPNTEHKNRILEQTKACYYSNQVIFEDKIEGNHYHEQNDFYQFLECDDRQAILDGDSELIDESVLRQRNDYILKL